MRQQILWKAQLENVTDVTLGPSPFGWALMIKCTSCNEPHEKPITLTIEDKEEMPGSRGVANLVMKCKFCRRDMSLHVVAEHRDKALTLETESWQPLATFEGRGIEISGFRPQSGFTAKGASSGHVFEDIDLSDSDGWSDYDDDGKCPVSVNEVEIKLVKL